MLDEARLQMKQARVNRISANCIVVLKSAKGANRTDDSECISFVFEGIGFLRKDVLSGVPSGPRLTVNRYC